MSDPSTPPAVASGPRELTDAEKRLVLGSLCLALFMVMLDGTVVNTALPKMQADLDASVAGLQWIVDGYVLAMASLMLTGGTLGDRFGRRRLLLGGIAVFTTGSILCGLAPATWALIGGRLVQGVGAAALMPGTLSILSNVFTTPAERARAIGIWAGVSGIALASGPVLGGLLADTLGWPSIFFVNLPVGIAAMIVIRRVTPESSDPQGRRPDLAGVGLSVLTLAPLTFALIQGNESGWSSPLIVGALAVSVTSLVLLLVVESRIEHPMLQLQFFRNPTFAAAVASGALVTFALFGMNVYFSLFFQRAQGHSALESGLRMLTISAVMAVGMPIAGRLTSTLGSKPVMMLGMGVSAVGMLSLLTVQPESSYLTIGPRMLLVGAGMALAMPSTTAAVMNSVPPARAGMGSATLNTGRQVGSVVGVALLGALVSAAIAHSLQDRMSDVGVPAAARPAVAEALARGGADLDRALPAGIDEAQVLGAYAHAFTDGMHRALFGAGLSLVIALGLVTVVVRRSAGLAAGAVSDPATGPGRSGAAAAAAAH
ncbi:MAG: MFS transporter [Acidimicrobiales bacterium]|nr:MFS transporter [Acidimicrobiales bacterium]